MSGIKMGPENGLEETGLKVGDRVRITSRRPQEYDDEFGTVAGFEHGDEDNPAFVRVRKDDYLSPDLYLPRELWLTSTDGFTVGDSYEVTDEAAERFAFPKKTQGKVEELSRTEVGFYVRMSVREGDDGEEFLFPFLPSELRRASFPVGTTVKVGADAATAIGGPVFFDGEGIVAEVTSEIDEDGDQCVRALTGGHEGLTQYVGVEYLTAVPDDDTPNEDAADAAGEEEAA